MTNKKESSQKMDLKSMDVGADNRAKLKQLFPSVFTETKTKDGELVESIDFDTLKAELGKFSGTYEKRRERYGMDWPGKKDCMKLIQKPSVATLKPCREESVNFDDTENLFIEGDNLEVLKLLQKSYYSKIKMIYIDPPYNTGKEFIYPDDYSESLETYLSYAGLIDDEGKKFSTNTPNEGRFHTKWLNMMYPRLYLARNLLREDGVIFISIADHEVTNLRKLCDEIFGEENHLGTVIWKNATDNNPTNIAVEHEYIHVYCKYRDGVDAVWKSHVSDIKVKLIDIGNKLISKYSVQEELQAVYTKWFRDNKAYLWPLDRYKYMDKKGVYTGSQSVHNPGKEGYRYDVIHPYTGKACQEPLMGYRFPEETMKKLLEEGKILFGDDESKIIELKVYASEYQEKLASVLDIDGRLGAYDIKNLFPEMKKAFTNPKPVRLLEHFVPFIIKNSEDIIIDFFSGSCTTAQAVIDLNKKDGGKRKFIMVQLPEPCDEKSDAFKAGYKNIADIGKERIRRVIKKIEKEQTAKAKKAKEKLPGMAEDIPDLDLGFKVLKLDKSNFKIWDGSNPNAPEEDIAKQLEMFVEHIDSKASQEDILYELLLKAGYLPTKKIKKISLADKTVYSLSDGSLLICLEDEITSDLINAVAESKPRQFICLDRGFQGNDQLKANAVQTFAALNQNREKAEQIIFRTV